MSKLTKITETKTFDIPFRRSMFFVYLFAALLVLVVGIVLLLNVEKLFAMGFVLIAVAFFVPTIVGFDLVSSYVEKYNIPKLKHPRRFLILGINLFLGLTAVGWLIALYMACAPGKVLATVETFETETSETTGS